MKKYFSEKKGSGKKSAEKQGDNSCFEREDILAELFDDNKKRMSQTGNEIQMSHTDRNKKTSLPASFFIAFLFILTNSMQVIAAQDHVLITQLYYDPVTTETGGEAIELYNPTEATIDISQYVIKTKSSAVDATIPFAKSILPHHYFLLADIGWNMSKDNSSWPNADYEEAITLVNTDGGVALLFNGTIIDAVGYGNVTDTQLFEGTSAQMVPQGNVLQRNNFSDSNNNSFDFFGSSPVFHNASFQEKNVEMNTSENAVVLFLNVTNTLPVVESITIVDDDFLSEGTQVQPIPGMNTTTNISIVVSDQNGFSDIKKVEGKFTGQESMKNFSFTNVSLTFVKKINQYSSEYAGTLHLPYYLASQEYVMNVTVYDEQGKSSKFAAFTYLNVTALSLDTESLFLSNGTPNGIITILGDLDFFSSSQPTIRNIGNTPLDIGVYGSALTNGKQIIPLQNIQFSFDNFKIEAYSATENVELYPEHVLPSDSAFQLLGLRLLVPSGLTTGMYSGKVAIVGAAS